MVLAKAMGYSGIEPVVIQFGADPVADVKALGIDPGETVAIVAPLWVGLALLKAGYTLIEFVNESDAREHGRFELKGAYRHGDGDSRFVRAADVTPPS